MLNEIFLSPPATSSNIFSQFREQATLTGVAQAVVDKAVRLHHDWYMSNSTNNSCSTKREDITLVLRNFNYPLPNAITSPSLTFNPIVGTVNSTLINSVGDMEHSTNVDTVRTDTSSSSSCVRTESDSGVGPDQRIEPYVNFMDYYESVKAARKNGTLPNGLDF